MFSRRSFSSSPPSTTSSTSPSVLLLTLVALSTMSLSLAGDHFILTRLSTLALARLDPIVNPGDVSSHVHNIIGGSCFNQDPMSGAQQQACDCSSAIVGDDKSSYWAPLLYYQYPNGTLSPLLNGNRVYYFIKSEDVEPFPAGLKMISGTAKSRNTSDTKNMGVRISCNHGEETKFLPNGTSHPDGCHAIQMGIFFPSCGRADRALTSDDHFSHMAWPIKQLGGGADPFDDVNGAMCPESHPIKYPTMFLQLSYYLTSEQTWHGGNPVVLSNGDQLGPSYHADFSEGWKQSTLKAAIKECGYGNGVGEQLDQCKPFAASLSESATWDCRYQSKIPNEDVGLFRPIDKLPGCNPMWGADGPVDRPPCNEENPPALVYPNVQFTNLQYRERLPLVFTEAGDNTTNIKAEFIPGLGERGASFLTPWGSDGVNAANLKISTISELGVSDDDSKEPASSSSATSDAASSTTSTASSSSAASSKPSLPAGELHAGLPAVASSSATSISAPHATQSTASRSKSVTSRAAATSSRATHKSTHAASSTASRSAATHTKVGKPQSTKTCHRKERSALEQEIRAEVSRELHAHLQQRSPGSVLEQQIRDEMSRDIQTHLQRRSRRSHHGL